MSIVPFLFSWKHLISLIDTAAQHSLVGYNFPKFRAFVLFLFLLIRSLCSLLYGYPGSQLVDGISLGLLCDIDVVVQAEWGDRLTWKNMTAQQIIIAA
jgi:hypothetical protein